MFVLLLFLCCPLHGLKADARVFMRKQQFVLLRPIGLTLALFLVAPKPNPPYTSYPFLTSPVVSCSCVSPNPIKTFPLPPPHSQEAFSPDTWFLLVPLLLTPFSLLFTESVYPPPRSGRSGCGWICVFLVLVLL